DPAARIFGSGDRPVVYVRSEAFASAKAELAGADVVDAGEQVSLDAVLEDLTVRGVARLLVEGGTSVHTQLLTAALADELRLAVAPSFVGASKAPRSVGDGRFPWTAWRAARLASVTHAGDVAVLRYGLSSRFDDLPPAGQ